MRLRLYPLLVLVAVILVAGPVRADHPTRDWVTRALEAALAPPRDLNAVASLVFPLTAYGDAPAIHDLLERTATVVAGIDPAGLDCGQRADALLLSGFLEKAGIALDPGPAAAAYADCESDRDLFATINALLSACRFGVGTIPEGLERVARAVRRDGSVDGGYYTTSHAVLALYSCNGDRAAVARGQGYLLRALPAFLRRGFLDGLAESLIFLRWMGVPVPGEGAYLGYLERRITPDGGLCLFDRPACRAHWHATSLLLELNRGAP